MLMHGRPRCQSVREGHVVFTTHHLSIIQSRPAVVATPLVEGGDGLGHLNSRTNEIMGHGKKRCGMFHREAQASLRASDIHRI